MQKSTHSAGGVVIGPHGKIVIVSQGGISWSFPKGHLEAGETARQAADREITEETDLRPIDPVNPEARWVEADAVASLLTHAADKAFFVSILPVVRAHQQYSKQA